MKTIRAALVFFTLSLMAGTVPAAQRTDIHASASEVQPLLPGMSAPAFDVLDAAGQPVAFDPNKMDKPLVLTFFRGGWCPYCNLHLSEMRQVEAELEALGFDIWFISIDKPELLYASLDQPDIGYVVLSDAKLAATRSFGLAFRVADETITRYLEHDIDLERASGESHHVLPAPAIYIIGADGVIRFQYTNPDYTVRLHPEILMAAAKTHIQDVDGRLRRAREAAKNTQ